MNEQNMKQHIQKAIDSTVRIAEDVRLSQRIIALQKGEEAMKRKLSWSAVLITALSLVAVIAIASTLIFSQGYDFSRKARDEMKSKYGIDESMLTVFHISPVKEENGQKIITFSGTNEWAEQLGVYTATQKDKEFSLSWSHDGKSTEGGLDAAYWGKEQIQLICNDYENTFRSFTKKHGVKNLPPTEEEIAKTMSRQKEDAEAIKAISKVTEEEAWALAQDAIIQAYPYIGENLSHLEKLDFLYQMYGDQPAIYVSYGYTEETHFGNYEVYIHAETKEILEVLYDSGMAGNG